MRRLFHIFANRSNIGDWLSARAIQSQLEGRVVHELLCDTPEVEETLRVLSVAAPGDFIVIGGGGLLMDYFMPFWQGFAQVATRIPFAVWGVGICDMMRRASQPDKKILRAILSQARLCVLRDDLSREFFADLPLPEAVPCPSLLSIESAPREGAALLHAVHYEITGEAGYRPLVEQVRRYALATGRDYLETNNEVPADNKAALLAETRLYAMSELVVSSRLHGCILALAHGCKVLAIAGDRKLEAFMRAASLSEWIAGPDDPAAIERLLERLLSQADSGEFVRDARRRNIEIGRRLNQLVDGTELVKSS